MYVKYDEVKISNFCSWSVILKYLSYFLIKILSIFRWAYLPGFHFHLRPLRWQFLKKIHIFLWIQLPKSILHFAYKIFTVNSKILCNTKSVKDFIYSTTILNQIVSVTFLRKYIYRQISTLMIIVKLTWYQ